MAGRKIDTCRGLIYGGNVKIAGKMQVLVALTILGGGLVVAGCKSGPPLTKEQAQALIQAKYDSMPPAPISINVNDQGMGEGVAAKYWLGTRRYPNGYWGDFQLTPEGKKVLTLVSGGDVIQWRPSQPDDPHYAIAINTVATNHLKADDLGDMQDQPGGSKMVDFDEDVVWTGVPEPLQGIGHNPGNSLSTKRTAIFSLQNGAWTLQSIN